MRVVDFPLRTGRIGVLSDTHIPVRVRHLPPEIFTIFEGVSLILHVGDIVEENVLWELEVLAPVLAVAGNMDPPELREKLGTAIIVSFGEVSLGLIHGYGAPHATKKKAVEAFQQHKVDGVIFGHTHEPLVENKGGLMVLNPGSVSDPRRGSSSSCALIHLENTKMKGEIISLKLKK